VGIAFAANLAVGDDVDAGFFEIVNREPRRVVLRRFALRLGDAPHLRCADAWNALGRLVIDKPGRLRIGTNDRGGDKRQTGGHIERNSSVMTHAYPPGAMRPCLDGWAKLNAWLSNRRQQSAYVRQAKKPGERDEIGELHTRRDRVLRPDSKGRKNHGPAAGREPGRPCLA